MLDNVQVSGYAVKLKLPCICFFLNQLLYFAYENVAGLIIQPTKMKCIACVAIS